jgi:hypothetical protein
MSRTRRETMVKVRNAKAFPFDFCTSQTFQKLRRHSRQSGHVGTMEPNCREASLTDLSTCREPAL